MKSRFVGSQMKGKFASKKTLNEASDAADDENSVERELLEKLRNESSIEYQEGMDNYLYSSADDAHSSFYTTKGKKQKA